jgi:hypothetical protein
MGYLQPDSTLIYPCRQDDYVLDGVAAAGGRIIKYDWDGNVLWDWQCDWEYQLHHDIEPTPDGTILALAMEDIDGFRPDVILDIEPVGYDGANLVWSWKVSEHMSEELNNPHTFYTHAGYSQLDWNHFNAVSLNDEEISLSSRNWSEVYVIAWDWGNGDILHRWGNPQNYGNGIEEDRILFAQHGVNQIPNGYPGEGNYILFNNMNIPGEQEGNSVVMEFDMDSGDVVWTFDNGFYGAKQSGAFRLPNGNTFVTVMGDDGMFEVTHDGIVVWEHFEDGVVRAQKYGLDYLIPSGDVNQDGTINVLDVVLVVGYVLEATYIIDGDINQDDVLNVLDIVMLVNIILGV